MKVQTSPAHHISLLWQEMARSFALRWSGSAHCMVGQKYVPVSEATNMKEYASMNSEVRNMKRVKKGTVHIAHI